MEKIVWKTPMIYIAEVFIYSKSTIEISGQCVKFIQS